MNIISEKKFFPFFIVFTAGFCLMTVEIVAGRIMAPYLGVSLYTWTSVISAVFAGIAAGNFYGGRIADQQASAKLVGVFLLISAATTAASAFLAGPIGTLLERAPVAPGSILFALFVFFPPAFFISTITPIIIKLELKNLSQTGNIVGRLYAFSSVGSIAGTLVTGFIFMAFFGTKRIISAVALLLFITGLNFLWRRDLWKSVEVWGVLLFIGASFFSPSICTKESSYFCIQVEPLASRSNSKGYALILDHLIHGFIFPDPKRGVSQFWYEDLRVNSLLVAMTKKVDDAFSVLSLGGGGYIVPRYLEANYLKSKNVVVEIDPAVTEVAYEHLELKPDSKIQTVNQDGRLYMKRLEHDEKFNFIFGDTFNDLSVPYHLTTKEFNNLVKAHLAEDGFYAVHLLDSYPYAGEFLASFLRTMQESFGYVYLVPEKFWKTQKRASFVVIGSQRPIDREKWGAAKLPVSIGGALTGEIPGENSDAANSMYLASEEEVKEFLKSRCSTVLIDDYVPVENMLAALWRLKKTK